MMETQILHGLSLALDWFNSVDGHWYYTAGVVVASIPLTAAIVEGIKHLHLKTTSTEMTARLITFVLWVTGVLMTAADFVITQGTSMQALGHFLPFLAVVTPTIKAVAPDVYEVSKSVHNWTVNRESETQSQRLAATVKLANSFGTAANGVPVPATAETPTLPTRQQPDANLLQL